MPAPDQELSENSCIWDMPTMKRENSAQIKALFTKMNPPMQNLYQQKYIVQSVMRYKYIPFYRLS